MRCGGFRSSFQQSLTGKHALRHLLFEGGNVGGERQLAVQLEAEECGRLLVSLSLQKLICGLALPPYSWGFSVKVDNGHHVLGWTWLDLSGACPHTFARGARREKGYVIRRERGYRAQLAGLDLAIDVVAVDEPEERGKHIPRRQALLEDPPSGS